MTFVSSVEAGNKVLKLTVQFEMHGEVADAGRQIVALIQPLSMNFS